MNDEEYRRTQDTLNVAVALLKPLDLRGFLERLNKAQILGPILDARLFQQSSDKAEAVHRIASAAMKLQRVALEEEKAELERLGIDEDSDEEDPGQAFTFEIETG